MVILVFQIININFLNTRRISELLYDREGEGGGGGRGKEGRASYFIKSGDYQGKHNHGHHTQFKVRDYTTVKI